MLVQAPFTCKHTYTVYRITKHLTNRFARMNMHMWRLQKKPMSKTKPNQTKLFNHSSGGFASQILLRPLVKISQYESCVCRGESSWIESTQNAYLIRVDRSKIHFNVLWRVNLSFGWNTANSSDLALRSILSFLVFFLKKSCFSSIYVKSN